MAITFGIYGHNEDGDNTTPRSSPLSVTAAINTGDTAVLVLGTTQQTASPFAFSAVTSITNGGTWTKRLGPITAGVDQIEIWSTDAGAAVSASSVSIAFSPRTSDVLCASVTTYPGVLGIGTTATANGVSSTASVSLTTQDANNWVVGAHLSDTGNTGSAATGTLRGSNSTNPFVGNNSGALSITDNTRATVGALVNSVSLVASLQWVSGALELRTVAGVVSTPAPLLGSLLIKPLQHRIAIRNNTTPDNTISAVIATLFRRFFDDGGKGGSRGPGA